MVLVEIPWASRVWALPFLSVLAPSERYAARLGKRHKKITEWAWQMLLVLRRWYPKRESLPWPIAPTHRSNCSSSAASSRPRSPS
jgi:hypothetical protein